MEKVEEGYLLWVFLILFVWDILSFKPAHVWSYQFYPTLCYKLQGKFIWVYLFNGNLCKHKYLDLSGGGREIGTRWSFRSLQPTRFCDGFRLKGRCLADCGSRAGKEELLSTEGVVGSGILGSVSMSYLLYLYQLANKLGVVKKLSSS